MTDLFLSLDIIVKIKVMKLDFTTPNKSTLGWIDAYFQYHNSQTEKEAERIAGRNYRGCYDGWDKQPDANVAAAFYEFKSAMIRFNISEEDINNQ
jgi:hypothetical protein